MRTIEECYREGGEWCDLEKAQTLAAIVIAQRPLICCEIGVWMGGSLLPVLLALDALRALEASGPDRPTRRAIAIDPWSPGASVIGQADVDASWWGKADHEAAFRAFGRRLDKHGVRDLCHVARCASDDVAVPPRIDLLHIDGNHAEQAIRDVERFCPSVPIGGTLVMDDLAWTGGHVRRARDLAAQMGFQEQYPLCGGLVLRRTR